MGFGLERRLFVVRAAFAAIILLFIAMTVMSLRLVPKSEFVGAQPPEKGPLPTFSVVSGFPSEQQVEAALQVLGVTGVEFVSDSVGGGISGGVPVRFNVSEAGLIVDSISAESFGRCAGPGPSATDLEDAWRALVSFDGPTITSVTKDNAKEIATGINAGDIELLRFSPASGTIEYGTSNCYFLASLPPALSVESAGDSDIGTVSQALSAATNSLGSTITATDAKVGYLLAPADDLLYPAWFLATEAPTAPGTTVWVPGVRS